MSDMTRQERNCVDALLSCITHQNMKFTGDMSDPSAWRQYVRHNATTNEDEFIPSLFMDPIRSQVEFQELMVKTQLFVGFVDRIRSEYNGLEPLRCVPRARLSRVSSSPDCVYVCVCVFCCVGYLFAIGFTFAFTFDDNDNGAEELRQQLEGSVARGGGGAVKEFNNLDKFAG